MCLTFRQHSLPVNTLGELVIKDNAIFNNQLCTMDNKDTRGRREWNVLQIHGHPNASNSTEMQQENKELWKKFKNWQNKYLLSIEIWILH